jgi:16S rRNA (uracil1498-N3)-methyltransferase
MDGFMNLPRFFLPDLAVGTSQELSAEESHHLARVLRLKEGEIVEVFNGIGAHAQARVESVHKSSVRLKTETVTTQVRERKVRLNVATSLPKGDRQKWLVEKLTELGADRLIPLETERGVAQPTDNALERLERVALEACKQSRNDFLLQIVPPMTLAELTISALSNSSTELLLAHPYPLSVQPSTSAPASDCRGKSFVPGTAPAVCGSRSLQQWLEEPLPADVFVAIGPEGGFTDAEVELAVAKGWKPWMLTNNILRVETAVMMAAILLMDFFPAKCPPPAN